MQANEPLIVQLQARWRGTLVRQPYQERLSYLRSHQDKAVRLQAYWKGYKQRKAYQERLEYLKKQVAVVVRVSIFLVCLFIFSISLLTFDLLYLQIQAIARMWKARKKLTHRNEYFKEHVREGSVCARD